MVPGHPTREQEVTGAVRGPPPGRQGRRGPAGPRLAPSSFITNHGLITAACHQCAIEYKVVRRAGVVIHTARRHLVRHTDTGVECV